MPYHVVRQGECLSSIAQSYGFLDYRKIYQHPENAEFRRRRPDPNVIFPGDRLFIPEQKEKVETRSTGSTHRFEVRRPKTTLRLVLQGLPQAGGGPSSNRPSSPQPLLEQPLGNVRYRLTVDTEVFEGRSSPAGLIEHAIPATATQGLLLVWTVEEEEAPPHSWELRIGALDPVTELTGVQARLNNLGFDCGPVDGILGRRTARALARFQRRHRITPTGSVDDRTRQALRKAHDGL